MSCPGVAFSRSGLSDHDADARRAAESERGSLLEFGADYILVMHRDELGVERVMQFGLGSPMEVP